MPNGTDQLIVELPDQKKEAREQAVEVLRQRLDLHQNLIYAVMVVVGIGFIAVIIAVFDIFIQTNRYATDQLILLHQKIEMNKVNKSDFQYQSLQNSIENLGENFSITSSTSK